MPDNNQKCAWGDESIRIIASPPVYLLAATIISPEEPIEPLLMVKPKYAGKLHWRDMTYRLQAKSLRALSRVEHVTTIVVGAPLPKKKQERGRRKCLERLLPELESNGVSFFVLESRGNQKDKKDIELLLSMRRKGLIDEIEIAHKRAENEPKLWIPDQILGAYGDSLCETSGVKHWDNYWNDIERNIQILETTI